MVVKAQGEVGRIRLFSDFFTTDDVAGTLASRKYDDFIVAGQGSEDTDSGVIAVNGATSGAGRLTTTNEAEHTLLVGTEAGFSVALNGTIVMEARVQFNNLDTKEVFIGFSDIPPATMSIETDIMTGATTTLTLTASDICGFYLSAELTADESWHAAYAGGTTTGETDSTAVDLAVDAVAGEWQILRLEMAPNGTARWYIDDVLKKTVEGAVSTSTLLAAAAAVEAKGAAVEEMDLDYLLVKANRDWNA